MPTMLPIAKMSTVDKLRAMEDLWTSLTTESSPFPLPTWHKAELRETEKRVESGEEAFIDWEEAKKSLRRRAK
jgi:hypothetical protein